MKFIMIYTTHSNLEEAKKITDHLLKEKLIACVNFFPITAEYQWKGEIERAEEITAILKTKKENWESVKKYIENAHSYETPCIIKVCEVEANESYAAWLESETS